MGVGKLEDVNLKIVKNYFNALTKSIPKFRGLSIGEYFASGGQASMYTIVNKKGDTVYALRIIDTSKFTKGNKDFIKKQYYRSQSTINWLMQNGQAGRIAGYLYSFECDAGNNDKLFCMVMEFLLPMERYANAAGRTEYEHRELAVRVAADLLPLLDICFRRQGGVLLHRDIKPDNMFLRGSGNGNILLGDWGIAKEKSDTGVTPQLGSRVTIAPEIYGADGSINKYVDLCDMYSLAIVIYYYLNDCKYPDPTTRLQVNPVNEWLPPPRHGSKEIKAVILKATNYYPKNRYSSPAEMLEALRGCPEFRQYINESMARRAASKTVPDNMETVIISKTVAPSNTVPSKTSNSIPSRTSNSIPSKTSNSVPPRTSNNIPGHISNTGSVPGTSSVVMTDVRPGKTAKIVAQCLHWMILAFVMMQLFQCHLKPGAFAEKANGLSVFIMKMTGNVGYHTILIAVSLGLIVGIVAIVSAIIKKKNPMLMAQSDARAMDVLVVIGIVQMVVMMIYWLLKPSVVVAYEQFIVFLFAAGFDICAKMIAKTSMVPVIVNGLALLIVSFTLLAPGVAGVILSALVLVCAYAVCAMADVDKE